MMQLTRDTDELKWVIQSYEAHQLKINHIIYEESVILTPDHLEKWAPQHIQDLTEQHMKQLLSHHPEVVLLGTGEKQCFPSDSILQPLIEKNLSIEVMSTRHACYTFKILISEGRKVVAGLIIS